MLRATFRGRLKPGKDDKTASNSGIFSRRDDDLEKNGSNEEINHTAINVQYKKQTLKDNDQEEEHIDFQDNYESAQSDSSDKEDADAKKHFTKTKFKADDRSSFSSSERAIYEMQLAQLQEQLVAAMIVSQEANAQLASLKATNVESLKKELENEREKNRSLKEKLKQKQKAASSKLQRKPASRVDPRRTGTISQAHSPDMDWVDLGQDFDDLSKVPSICRSLAQQSAPEDGAIATTVSSVSQGTSSSGDVTLSGDEGAVVASNQDVSPSKCEVFKDKVVHLVLDRLWDFLNDDHEADEVEIEEEQLAVKTLKENISRFTNGIRPITNFVKSVSRLMSWKSPTATFLALVVYMYAVWYGVLFPLILLLVIWRLFMNYLHARGIAKQLGFSETPTAEESSSEEYSWSDKFHLVLQVARKVQNTLGKLADSLEKIKNLLMWQHHAAGRLLFIRLCLLFVASLVFSGPRLFMIGGLALGFKMFITKPLYSRFPKVKKRYDDVARMWSELPTDSDLAAREEFEMAISRFSTASSGAANSNGTHAAVDSCDSSVFSDKFNLPPTETPLPDWEEGRRCILMDKDKPLSHIKHGRLFMSQSHLCFEKQRGKHIVIKLEDIKSLSKAKPIGLMPGTGMALEIRVRGLDKPYIFGAIIGRNEVYENIRAAGKAANLPWASG